MAINRSDEKRQREREVFGGFARICPIPIDPNSIENREPPEPDIRCALVDGTQIAFELTEVIDFTVARRRGGMGRAVEDFERLMEKLPKNAYLKQQFGDAVFRVALHDPGHGFGSRRTVEALLMHLENPESIFRIGKDEFVRAPIEPELRAIRSIGIGRGRHGGPHLVVQGGSQVAIPAEERVADKLECYYAVDVPLELLLYVDRQPRAHDGAWIDSLAEFVSTRLDASQFDRYWVYDHRHHCILLSMAKGQARADT